ncbi:MAG: hypothetical protein KDD42_10355 [Bdellovibrionales bacterium]|nr:hypothetical protein [Bdellovibrionales bacterium]
MEQTFQISNSAQAWLISRLFQEGEKITVICADRISCEKLAGDLEFFIGSKNVYQLPAWDTLPFEAVSPQHDISAQRLHALHAVSNKLPHVVVTSIDSIIQKVLPPKILKALEFTLKAGLTMERDKLVEQLDLAGY